MKERIRVKYKNIYFQGECQGSGPLPAMFACEVPVMVSYGVLDDKTYMAEIRGCFQDIFDEGSSEVKNRPVELLRYVRTNEERVKEGNNRL